MDNRRTNIAQWGRSLWTSCIVALSTFGSLGASCGGNNPGPIPADTKTLEYRLGRVLNTQVHHGWEITLLGTRNYHKPKGDCRIADPASLTFAMDDPDEYIDVTITMRDGILPGPANGKAFVLQQRYGIAGGQRWTLHMEQRVGAFEPLREVTWRLKLNGAYDPNQEIGDGSKFMPPLGKPPWERPFLRGTQVGGTWTITNTDSLESPFTASLEFRLHAMAEVCPNHAVSGEQ